MRFIFPKDRVRENSTTTGPTDFALSGAQSGFIAFSDIMINGDTTPYAAIYGSEWEVGIGTWVTGPALQRTTILASSNGGAAVSFSPGTKDIFNDIPSALLATMAQSGTDYLVNGDGQINQAVAGVGIADGAYGHDQWVALTQTGTIAVSTLTDVEDGLPNMIRLTQSQATAQRMGYIQPLEASRVKRLRGKTVSLLMRLRNSTGGAIRYAIVEHTGTADTLTKDIVDTWTSSSYITGSGNFFTAQSGDITVRAVGSITPSANTLTDALLTATLGSSFKNLYVFVWTEAAAAQNSTLDMACNLRRGYASAPVIFRPEDEEKRLCKRFYRTTYEGVAPGTATRTGLVTGGGNYVNGVGYAQWIPFDVEMRNSSYAISHWDGAGAASKTSYYVATGGGTWTDGRGNLEQFPANAKNGFAYLQSANDISMFHYVASCRF